MASKTAVRTIKCNHCRLEFKVRGALELEPFQVMENIAPDSRLQIEFEDGEYMSNVLMKSTFGGSICMSIKKAWDVSFYSMSLVDLEDSTNFMCSLTKGNVCIVQKLKGFWCTTTVLKGQFTFVRNPRPEKADSQRKEFMAVSEFDAVAVHHFTFEPLATHSLFDWQN